MTDFEQRAHDLALRLTIEKMKSLNEFDISKITDEYLETYDVVYKKIKEKSSIDYPYL